jgi:hypothetical protein
VKLLEVTLFEVKLFEVTLFEVKLFEVTLFEVKLFEVKLFEVTQILKTTTKMKFLLLPLPSLLLIYFSYF